MATGSKNPASHTAVLGIECAIIFRSGFKIGIGIIPAMSLNTWSTMYIETVSRRESPQSTRPFFVGALKLCPWRYWRFRNILWEAGFVWRHAGSLHPHCHPSCKLRCPAAAKATIGSRCIFRNIPASASRKLDIHHLGRLMFLTWTALRPRSYQLSVPCQMRNEGYTGPPIIWTHQLVEMCNGIAFDDASTRKGCFLTSPSFDLVTKFFVFQAARNDSSNGNTWVMPAVKGQAETKNIRVPSY